MWLRFVCAIQIALYTRAPLLISNMNIYAALICHSLAPDPISSYASHGCFNGHRTLCACVCGCTHTEVHGRRATRHPIEQHNTCRRLTLKKKNMYLFCVRSDVELRVPYKHGYWVCLLIRVQCLQWRMHPDTRTTPSNPITFYTSFFFPCVLLLFEKGETKECSGFFVALTLI